MSKSVRSDLLTIAEKEKAKREAESVIADTEKTELADELVIAKEEKTELANELVIANAEKAERAEELVIADAEKADRAAELVIANEEKADRAAELVIANAEKEKRAAELVIANEEKEKRAAELVIANEEKEKRASELVIANAEKAKRAAELVIANAEKAKHAAVLVIANLEKEKLADELIIADKELVYQNEEKVKRAAELVIADVNKTKREAELVIAKIEKAKRIAKSIIVDKELSFQTEEKSKRAAELVIADAEKAKRAAELVIANIKKAKRSAELVIANVEKAKRSAELVIANKELVYQKSEKSKRAAELIIANVEKAKRAAELVIANIEKSKRAAELVFTNKELALAKEKEKLVVELTIVNKELTHQIEKRKQTELALKETNEKYSKAFQSSPYSITITRAEDGKFIEVNDAFISISGFTKEEVLENSGVGLNMWVDIKEQEWVLSTLLDGNDVTGKEFLFKKKNGEIIMGLFSAKIIKLNNELCVISSINDITERKLAEKAMLESEELLKFYMDNSPMAVVEWDFDFRITRWTGGAEKIFGWKAEEMVGKQLMDLNITYEQDIPNVQKTGEKIKCGLFTQVFSCNRNYRKDGSIITCEWYNVILKNENGIMQSVLSKILDITERKQTELALKASEKEFRSLAESMPQIVWTTRADGWNTYFNQQWVDYTGLTLEESYGHGWNTPFHPEDKQRALDGWRKAIENNAEYSIDCRLRRYDGTYHWWLVRGVPQIGPKGEILKWFGTCTDIEKIKNAEFELKKKFDEIESINKELSETNVKLISAKEKAEESDRLKSAFLTNMSHEIRTPMNGILGFTELLKEPNLSSDDLQDYIQTIQISGARMLSTINSIVDISKIESGLIGIDIKETNLNEKIEFTYKFFKQEAEIKGLQFLFKNGLPTNKAIIKTDNEKVYGILTNLVRNAIKFTFDGSIEFGYVLKSDSEPGSAELSRSAELEFYVKDTGVGIPLKQQQLIFERFRQGSESHNRSYEGSGLGLSISKSYAEMLGGRIWVESEEGLGSAFYFTIPYNAVSEKETERINAVSEEHNEVELRRLKILIVEDDEISHSLLSRTLQKISKEVLHAITGVEAVEACRNNPDIDLVLMDIRMPLMNGFEATSQIRQFNKDVIIIAQTAYAFAGDIEKAIEAGCNDYISKPINKTLLYELIKKHVNK
jgi:PAS domain S-box-containing protein